jgi:hypothetical protein
MNVLAGYDPTLLKRVFAVAVLLTLAIACQEGYRARNEVLYNDFDRWMTMAPAFVHGTGRYVDDQLPTPPVSLLILGPLSLLPRTVSQFLWVVLKLPFAVAVLLLCLGMSARAGIRVNGGALLLTLACWWLPIVVDMQEGQVNFLALLPLAAGLYVAQNETARSDIAAGLLIALGAAMKVTPLVFIAYFAWQRRWRIALSSLVGLVLWSLLLPAVVFGWTQNLTWFGQWMRIMIVPYTTSGAVFYSDTQSVGSFAVRLLTDRAAFWTHHDTVEYGHMNVVSLSTDLVQQFVRMLMIGVAVAGLVWMRKPLTTLRSPRYMLQVGAVAAFMLWFSERTWVHHYVSFVITLSAAGMVLSDVAVPERCRRRLSQLLIFFAIAAATASDLGRMFGPHGVAWAKAFGVFLWPSVVVTLGTLAIQNTRAVPGAASGSGRASAVEPLAVT